MKIKTENKKVEDIAILLFADANKNPLSKYLNYKELDFSLDSLREVDKYLEKIRKNKKKLNEEDLKKVILRCGTYLGEVIRKITLNEIIWASYETASNINKEVAKFERSLLTHILLYDQEKERFWFPLAKVYKFLENGKGDNLWSFAMVCLEEHNK